MSELHEHSEFEREDDGLLIRETPLSSKILSFRIGPAGWIILGTLFLSEIIFLTLLVMTYLPEYRGVVNDLLKF